MVLCFELKLDLKQIVKTYTQYATKYINSLDKHIIVINVLYIMYFADTFHYYCCKMNKIFIMDLLFACTDVPSTSMLYTINNLVDECVLSFGITFKYF